MIAIFPSSFFSNIIIVCSFNQVIYHLTVVELIEDFIRFYYLASCYALYNSNKYIPLTLEHMDVYYGSSESESLILLEWRKSVRTILDQNKLHEPNGEAIESLRKAWGKQQLTFKNRDDSLQLIIHQQLRYIQIKAPMCMTYAIEAWYSYKERISHEKKKL